MQESGCTKPVSVRNARVESIPFSSIPSQSKLFTDYQESPSSLLRYYPAAVESHIDIANRVSQVVADYSVDRGHLCNALLRISRTFEPTTETLANIELLRDSDTVAVLTGQQTGLFTGPLYSIYKAISAIKMAECLRGRGIKAVPVFWMATEDHDLAEVSNAFVIGDDGQLVESSVTSDEGDEGKPVGNVRLNESTKEALNALFNSLPKTEYSEQLHGRISAEWANGSNFGSAFGSQLSTLLGKYGLIVVDPLDDEIKRLAKPIYLEAIEKNELIVAALTARSKELVDDGYHAQVLIEDDYFPFFWHTDDGRRVALRRSTDGTFKVKGEKTRFTFSELKATAADSPGRFSPGVMLRPVVQDYLFPTVCYFGGGAEIAYFAQNSEVYRVLGRPVTPILHRQSFTVIEAKYARTLEKYGLNFPDLFSGEGEILSSVVDRFIDPATARLFAEQEQTIDAALNSLDSALSKLDVTLAANLATRRRKINYHISALRKKYQLRRAEKDEIVGRRIRSAFTSLLPNGHLQERTLNVLSFVDRFGPGFIDSIYDATDLNDKGHRVVYL